MHLIDLTLGIRSPNFFMRILKEFKEDLKVWQHFLTGFNGRSFSLNDYWCTSTYLELCTDTSGALGYGAVFGKHWCYGEWPDS